MRTHHMCLVLFNCILGDRLRFKQIVFSIPIKLFFYANTGSVRLQGSVRICSRVSGNRKAPRSDKHLGFQVFAAKHKGAKNKYMCRCTKTSRCSSLTPGVRQICWYCRSISCVTCPGLIHNYEYGVIASYSYRYDSTAKITLAAWVSEMCRTRLRPLEICIGGNRDGMVMTNGPRGLWLKLWKRMYLLILPRTRGGLRPPPV